MQYNITSKAYKVWFNDICIIEKSHDVLPNEEDKCMSNSEWNSSVASHSLVQIECGPSGVNFKQLGRATSVGVVVVGDKDH
jgi:hypothetical protein